MRQVTRPSRRTSSRSTDLAGQLAVWTRLNVPNFEPLPLYQEQHGVVRFHYLLKKLRRRGMQLWKNRTVNRRSLAALFLFGIGSSRKGGPLHHWSQRVGDRWFYRDNSEKIGTMLVDDDSLLQGQITVVGISQTTVKKIILSLFCNFCKDVRLRFYVKRLYGVLFALLGWFYHSWRDKLWAIRCLFLLFRFVPFQTRNGLVSLLKTQPLYIAYIECETMERMTAARSIDEQWYLIKVFDAQTHCWLKYTVDCSTYMVWM